MTSRPVRANHSIAADLNLERRVKSPSDAAQARCGVGNAQTAQASSGERRRSPTHPHKRTGTSRTPSPNLDNKPTKLTRGRTEIMIVKSPRSAFQEAGKKKQKRKPSQPAKKTRERTLSNETVGGDDDEDDDELKSINRRATKVKTQRQGKRRDEAWWGKDLLQKLADQCEDGEWSSRDIEDLQTLLDSKKQQRTHKGTKSTQTEGEPPRTPDLDAEVSHLSALAESSLDNESTVLDDAAAAATCGPSVAPPCDDDVVTPVLPERARAPTDRMFSSTVSRSIGAKTRKPPRGAAAVETYDFDRLNEISERTREREHLRGSGPPLQPIRSTLSSPETVISSVSDYTAWSCASPRSPNHVEFQHHPPPSFVPRIKLEALRSPRTCDAETRSPDPKKSASTLHSPCSAFTPRSTASDTDKTKARHKKTIALPLPEQAVLDTAVDGE